MGQPIYIGQIIHGRYEVVDLVDFGGEGTVAKALDSQTNNSVAVKQLSACPGSSGYQEQLARFQRSARIVINHPNVIDPIDYCEEGGDHYLITPFVEGLNLERFLRANGPKLSIDQAVYITIEVAKGLKAIHDKGIVHRDIKPQNIIIRTGGAPCIIDLGICRNTNEKTITSKNGLIGSLQWMSSEQASSPGSEDYRSDFYSLGAVFYLMLTGHPPVQGSDPASIILSICQYIPKAPHQMDPAVPLGISQICMVMLAKQRGNRFQAADDIINAFAAEKPSNQGIPCCPACGLQLPSGSRFCHTCGASLDSQVRSEPARCFACGFPVGEVGTCTNCNRCFSQLDHRLSFLTGSLTGSVFRIPEGIFVVGRPELSPRDFHISRQHVSVACSNGSIFIQDAGSTNNTYVSGQVAINLTQLKESQQVCIANNIATYSHNKERNSL